MLECSAVFLIYFIIYLTFSMEQKGIFIDCYPSKCKLKGFWWDRLNRIDPIIMVQKNYLTMFTSSNPLSKQPQQQKVFKNTAHFENLWTTQNNQINWAV